MTSVGFSYADPLAESRRLFDISSRLLGNRSLMLGGSIIDPGSSASSSTSTDASVPCSPIHWIGCARNVRQRFRLEEESPSSLIEEAAHLSRP